MNAQTYRRRVAELLKTMNGADTAWIIRPENRRYLSGFQADDTQFAESSGSLLINKRASILVTDSRYTDEANAEAPTFEVRTISRDFAEDFPQFVRELKAKNLGFEEGYLTWGLYQEVSGALKGTSPAVGLVPLEGVVEGMRSVKDPSEIRALEISAEMISRILDQVISELAPDMTEKEVAWRIEDLARESGAEGLSFPSIVASGPHSAMPHATPSDRKLREHEPIVLDTGVRVNGYRSDITRTIFLGEPEARFREIYNIVRQAQLAAVSVIRPGMESTDVDAVARDVIKNAGYGEYFGHSLGHGVGLAAHEQPRLAPRRPVRLEEGMVVTVEPGIYLPGKGGVRLEEMLVIEEGGSRTLTQSDFFYDFGSA